MPLSRLRPACAQRARFDAKGIKAADLRDALKGILKAQAPLGLALFRLRRNSRLRPGAQRQRVERSDRGALRVHGPKAPAELVPLKGPL